MNKLPLNLQFFAEEPEGKEEPETKEETKEETKDSKEPEKKDETPNVQELLVEISKLKRSVDKASSEAAEYKKKWKASMTEQEQISLEKAEAQAAKDAEFEALKKELSLRDGTERYMDLGMDKDLAKKAATAEVEGDRDSLNTILKQHQAAQKKKIEEEFYKKMPELNAGVGEKSISKEQFDKMTFAERTKVFRENRAEYDRLMAL